jgi:crotonobetainyl-CoA:carnitine CoA-transferase CaiB-like acyl-CoA transferase
MNALDGIIVLDFSQFLAGPSAALRLADLGARTIKVERPQGGDNGRRLVFENLISDGDGVLFHTINRNKESFCADLKNEKDLEIVKALIKKADVIIENFRPGVMDKLGLGYDVVKKINKEIVYASVTGYGSKGPWVKRPGQDLMVQSISGFVNLNGDDGDLPTPAALAMADAFAGIHLAEGILATLFRRFRTHEGGRVEISLLESIMDVQFEVFATYLNDGHQPPKRAKIHNAHPYLGAPYGLYKTKDDCIALSMGSVPLLGELMELPQLKIYDNPSVCFEKRDEIKAIIEDRMMQKTTAEWLEILEKGNYWCSEVLDWKQLLESPVFKHLDMLIHTGRPGHRDIVTTRCPIRINGEKNMSSKWAPSLGEDTEKITKEFNLLDSKEGAK